MLCRQFDDPKYMDIYLPICQEYSYFRKQKMSWYFSTSTCEHLWPWHSHLVYHVGAAILFALDQVMCDWLTHTRWFHSNQYNHSPTPKHGIWVNIALFIYTIQTPICYVGCLMIANTWTYISLYFRNTALLENKKQFVFSRISLWTLVTFTFTPYKLHKMWADSQ